MTLGMAETSQFHLILVSSLQGLAAGTILYVIFFEVLNNNQHHHDHHHRGQTNQSKSSILKLLFILSGFLFMVFLELMGECFAFSLTNFLKMNENIFGSYL